MSQAKLIPARSVTMLAAVLALGLGACGPTRGTGPGAPPRRSFLGVVQSYRMANLRPAKHEGDTLPLAYWVRLKAPSDGRELLLYVNPAKTDHDPLLDRHLLKGRTLRYWGASVPAREDRPAYVDTTVAGGGIAIVFGATSVRSLKECTVGKLVEFRGVIEPRQKWVKRFHGDWYKSFQLPVTLPSGEMIEIGDFLKLEYGDFRSCLKEIRARRAIDVRVVGTVVDSAPYKRTGKSAGTPRDVTGKVVVTVEELRILGHKPSKVKP